MKKLIYILLGIFTFSVGFWVYQFNAESNNIQLNAINKEKDSFSLCEIAENPKYYQSKQIKVRAFLAKGGYYDVISGLKVTDYKSDCASKITVNLSDELKRDRNFLNISNELEENRSEWQKGPRDGWAVAEVEFTGELVLTGKSGLSAAHYLVLTPTEVKQIASSKFIRISEVSPWNKELILN